MQAETIRIPVTIRERPRKNIDELEVLSDITKRGLTLRRVLNELQYFASSSFEIWVYVLVISHLRSRFAFRATSNAD